MATAPTRREQQLRVVTSPGAAEERFAAEASAAARGLDASRPQHAALPPPPPSPREALQHQAGEPFRIAGRATQNVPDTLRQLLPDRKHHGPLVTALPRTQSGGDGVTSQFALTIQPDIFKVETFDCEQFISSRRCLPLDTTKSELRSYLRQLKNELVELINKDYTDFISLSTSLVGTDKAIHELSQLLSRIRNEIQVIRDKFQETIDELEKRLAQRAELREQKAALQLLLNIARSVEKIASLLEAHHAEDATVEANEPGGRDKVNERVAIEFNQLRFLVGKGQEMSYVETIQPRIQKIESALRSSLATSLRSSLSACDASPQDDSMTLSLAQCLRTYAAIDQTREAEDIIAGEFVQPFIEKIIRSCSQLPPGPPDDPSCAPGNSLAGVYAELLGFVRTKCAPLILITEKTLRGAKYEVLTNGVWTQVVEALSTHLSTIFASGNPDVFHSNYKVTMDFVAEFEKLYLTRKSWAYLRTHRSYAAFVKKWQISVYFQLRFKEICVPFDDACRQPVDFPPASYIAAACSGQWGEATLALAVSKHLIRALRRCWAEDVYLRPLAHRFWKLSLQLVSRYSSWMRGVIQEIPDSSLNNETWSTAAVAKRGSGPIRPSSASASLQGSSSSSRHYATINDSASSDGTLVQLAAVSYESSRVCEVCLEFYDQVVKPHVGPLLDYDVLHVSLTAALDHIRAPLPEIRQRVVAMLVKRCCESLRQVRGITGQYRHMNRKPPNEPSHFVSQIFKPLAAFKLVCGPFFDRCGDPSVFTVMVCEPVTEKYTAQVTELLAALKATEDSLKRLKKGISRQSMARGATNGGEEGQGGGTAAPLSDEDKIRAQLWLDAVQYGEELASVGVQPETVEQYKQHMSAVEMYSNILQPAEPT